MTSVLSPQSSALPPICDRRVDAIGHVRLLVSHFMEPLNERVKSDLLLAGACVAEGEHYRGLLVAGGTVRTVSPELFLRMYERGDVTREQFVDAIRVNREAALQAVAGCRLNEISEQAPAAPQLRVKQIRKIAPDLMDAAESVGACLAASAGGRGRRAEAR